MNRSRDLDNDLMNRSRSFGKKDLMAFGPIYEPDTKQNKKDFDALRESEPSLRSENSLRHERMTEHARRKVAEEY